MSYSYLSSVTRFTKAFMGLMLFTSGILTLALCGRIYDVANAPEVRLRLDTIRPTLGGFWYDMKAGYADGSRGQRREERGPLPTLRLTAASFELAADPRTPLLLYREPSAWKRVGLLVLGAQDDGLSVAGLLLLAVGSWLLLRLLQDVTPATPFTLANARRLRQLTLLVFGLHLWSYPAYVLVWLLVPAYRVAGLVAPLSHYVRLNTDERVPGVAVGFMLLVITVVYQRGVALSQEAELVI